MNRNKTILIIANCFWYIYNFRLDLVIRLRQFGYKVIVVAPLDSYKNLVKEYVDEVKVWDLKRGSINPFLEIKSIFQLISIYKSINPQLIHNFTIKPCLYGGIAARLIGHKITISHITGIGPSFFGFSRAIRFLSFLLQPIYRYSFFQTSKIIFHNEFDQDLFKKRRICKKESSCVIQGSGVDINKFKSNKSKNVYSDPIQILFPARIIREKGCIELFEACYALWEEGYNFRLNIAGDIDRENKSTLTRKEIDNIAMNKNINFYGKVQNMKLIYNQNDIVVLPSWREGLSKSLIEAASMSLPIITTNVPGCEEIIENNQSGIIVPLKNKFFLKEAIKKLIKNPQLGMEYGLRARDLVKKKFEVSLINKKILKIYKDLLFEK